MASFNFALNLGIKSLDKFSHQLYLGPISVLVRQVLKYALFFFSVVESKAYVVDIVGLDRNKIVGVSKWGTETVGSVGAAGSKGAAAALDLQAGRVSKAKGDVKAAAGRGGRKRAATVRWEEAAAAGEKKTSMRAGSRGGGGLRGEDNNAKGRGGMGQRRVAAVAGDRSRRVWPVVGCSCGRIAATENRGAEGADGPQAGQTVPHVHIHILPRKKGDFEKNDEIYDAIDLKEKELKEKLDLDKERKDRTPEEMTREADEYRVLFS
ncbi:hypothetical protein GW17_00020266 [Ensete ventricosum]|nr:hypothetical protein GW17_00020266 [Ensete ventricosum]RZR83473.1 hypothetical protein BHM03_00010087 [Ensete ventricosum]